MRKRSRLESFSEVPWVTAPRSLATAGRLVVLSQLALLAATGCASPGPKIPSPSASPPASEALTEPTSSPPAATEATPPSEPASRGGQTVEILGEESHGGQPLSLLEASRIAKERNRNSQPPRIVINNKNLAEYAKRGNITYASPKPPESPSPEGQETKSVDARDEHYWRSGAAEIRQDWRQAIDDLKGLKQQAEELRFKFYSTDDAAYRDLQVKPEWDRTLDRISDARKAVEDGLSNLDEFLEEGRAAGALPGWLREGIELEPTDEELAALFDDETTLDQGAEPVVTNDPPLVGDQEPIREEDEDP